MAAHELECVLTDGFDREVYARLVKKSKGVAQSKLQLSRLLPHPDLLLQDLFSILFKLNVVVRPAKEVSASVLIHRRLIEAVLKSPGMNELRARTELSEVECAIALPLLAERVLKSLSREYRVNPSSLAEIAEAAEKENQLDALVKEREHLDEVPFDPAMKDALARDLDRDIKNLEKEIGETHDEQSKLAANLTTDIEDKVETEVGRLPEDIDSTAEHMRGLGLGAGRGNSISGEQSFALGDKLLRSKKLRLLAKLAGAFREVAFEARRQRVARSPQTLHAIETGAALDRILPSEILGLSATRRGLHLDFLRRLAERQLLQYELIAPANRGPMVVCVDGSASMAGSKEIWAKAVALTLMEIARREKRRCLALIFSSGVPLFECELLGPKPGKGGRAEVRDEEVIRFAEHFPAGGTSFEEPLRRAVEAVSEGRYRRGDIVFITDGEATVTPDLIAEIDEQRRKHRFFIRGILVDVAHSSAATVERFADEVRRVTDIAGESMADLFSAV